TGPTSGSWYDYVTVKKTTGEVLATDAVKYDDTAAGNGPIGAQESRPRHYSFTLPDGRLGAGQIEVTVTADYYNQLFEHKAAGDPEKNNSATRTFTSALAPYPDFSVASLTVTSDTGLHSGADVTVSWDDVNSLTGAANTAPFSDYVAVQNTTG